MDTFTIIWIVVSLVLAVLLRYLAYYWRTNRGWCPCFGNSDEETVINISHVQVGEDAQIGGDASQIGPVNNSSGIRTALRLERNETIESLPPSYDEVYEKDQELSPPPPSYSESKKDSFEIGATPQEPAIFTVFNENFATSGAQNSFYR